MALTLTITAAGRAALVNAAHDGTAPVRIASVGVSAQALAATPATAALPGEIKRIATLSGDVVAADTIHLIVRDESADNYAVRAFALYLADGTLFAAYGQSPVIVEKSAQALLLLAIDVRFADIAATQISFGDANFLNPPATTDRLGVVELATDDEAREGTDTARALTPRGAMRALLSWLGFTPANRAGDDFSGPVSAATPNASTTGGLRLRGNPTSGYAYFQVTNNDLNAEWGNMQFDATGRMRWSGALAVGGDISRSGARVWDAANDGAGSGLDADLLDGQQGSYYTDITARLGYRPFDKDAGGSIGGNVEIARTDNAALSLNASGAVVAKLVSQADGNIVFYRNIGTGDRVVWSADNTAFNLSLPVVAPQIIAGGNLVARGGAGEGGQLVLGYRGRNALTGQDNGTWNLDVDDASGLRFFQQRNDGTIRVAFGMDETEGRARFALAPLVAGATVWHAGNDGAGSGLDADLLDGQQGSYYTDIPARLGYRPFDRDAGGSIGGNVEIARTDNAALSLNASGAVVAKLVSQADGNIVFYRNIGTGDRVVWSADNTAFNLSLPVVAPQIIAGGNLVARGGAGEGGQLVLGYRGRTALTGQEAGTWNLDVDDASGLRFFQQRNDGTIRVAFAMDEADGRARFPVAPLVAGATVWHAGNDGAGSGLDADTLDGFDSSAFLRVVDSGTLGQNAKGFWERRPNGVIEQWGTTTFTHDGTASISRTVEFPIPFTAVCFGATGNSTSPARTSGWNPVAVQCWSPTPTDFYLNIDSTDPAHPFDHPITVFWRAIGR